jgi:hypothetical protein
MIGLWRWTAAALVDVAASPFSWAVVAAMIVTAMIVTARR